MFNIGSKTECNQLLDIHEEKNIMKSGCLIMLKTAIITIFGILPMELRPLVFVWKQWETSFNW